MQVWNVMRAELMKRSLGAGRKRRRLLKWTAFALASLVLLSVSRDALRFNVAEQASQAYRFDVVQYQLTNFFDKWVHRLIDALPWHSLSKEERRLQIAEYFELGEEISRLRRDLQRAAARAGGQTSAEVSALEERLDDVRARSGRLRQDVEETVESTISAVVVSEGLGTWGEFIFPPVDIRLAEPPKLLVTSPRDRIERTHDVLLEPKISIGERESVEQRVEDAGVLSAVVVDIGGVATFPASLPNDRPLQWTLQTSAHEWLHHYLFFRPLGQNISKSDDMQVLNETVADIAGREIGNRAFQALGGEVDGSPEMGLQRGGSTADAERPKDREDGAFNFNRVMRETRLRVDALLAEGLIDEAEAYMEQRRKLFVTNGFNIRTLNQAYFAFHGTYADSPASVSPIGGQLQRMRSQVPDVGSFVRAVARFTSYQEFLESLDALEGE